MLYVKTPRRLHDAVKSRRGIEDLVNHDGSNTMRAIDLMAVNDSKHVDEAHRERRVKEEFALIGVEVEFIN